MCKIVLICHKYDRWKLKDGSYKSKYLLFDVLKELERRGHSIGIMRGVEKKCIGDVAVLHVDATFTPQEYIEVARSFRVCLNAGATNISKRYISGALLQKGEQWNGPAIVKSNLNCFGKPEASSNQRAEVKGSRIPFSGAGAVKSYTIYQTVQEIPQSAFDDPDLVVEKFIPEQDRDGHATRFWVFCGDRERCNRYVSPEELVKASNAVRCEPAPVPDELRLRREELGFDFGKFDFVVHEGKAVLLDANNTPTRPPNLSEAQQVDIRNLADGFEGLIKEQAAVADKATSHLDSASALWKLSSLRWPGFGARK